MQALEYTDALTISCRYVWATGTFANNATILAKVNELTQAAFSNLTTKNGNFTFTNSFQPIPRSITSKSAATGGNVLGLDPKGGDLICMTLPKMYNDPIDSQICRVPIQGAVLGRRRRSGHRKRHPEVRQQCQRVHQVNRAVQAISLHQLRISNAGCH